MKRSAFTLCSLFLTLFALSQGNNMSNPIVMGTYAAGTYTYTDTRNTGSYGNDYGNASPDIYYKFTVQGNTTITISTCGSGWDTYLWLLNSGGTELTHDDDSGPSCSGLTASIGIPSSLTTFTSLAAGTYYIVAEGYGSNSGTVSLSVNLTVQGATVYNTRNFIRTWEATAPETNASNLLTRPLRDVKQSTAYFDGLGRPEQTVVKKGSLSSAGNTDIVTPFEYDQFGREVKKFLPYAAGTSDGLFKTGATTAQNSFYSGSSSPVYGQGENTFYALTDYEPSPLNRVAKQMAPGASWAGGGRGIQTNYWINTSTDAVRIWNVTDVTNSFGIYASSSIYPAGELFKTATTDEEQHEVIEFKDKDGKVILKKVQLTAAADNGTTGSGHAGWLCTYYIYDDLGQLRCVVQPKAVESMNTSGNWNLDNANNTTILNELCFRYEYDGRGRMIMKKVPGAGPVYMVYDARDRLVMTQDANLRAQQKWMVTVYENSFNRPVYTYLITDPSNYNNLAYHKGQAYGSISYPTVSNYTNELLTETHYDNYTGLPTGLYSTLYNSGYGTYLTASAASPDYAEPLTQSTAVKGMVTWTRTKVLGTASQYLASVNIYDEKGRVIQTQSINVTGGLDVVTNQYSFSGQILRSHVKHQKAGTSPQSYDVATKNNYDDLGRITSTEKNINNTGWKQISSLTYDAVGQLKTKRLSPAYNSNQGLETLIYDYNIRGWLLGINRSELSSNGAGSKKFAFELGYDKPTNTSGRNFSSDIQYNGNITGMIWKSAGDGIRRKYDFSYDAANRLMQGLFEQNNAGTAWDNTLINYTVKMGNGTDPNSAYDANGNIKQIQQWGWKVTGSTQIDNLSYNYRINGTGDELRNKLFKVSDGFNDAQTKLGDFKDGTNGGDDYNYDANGNLTLDNNKSISSITYNHLNLPNTISVTGKGSVSYVYDAAGNKLKKIVQETGQPTKTTLYLFGTYENDVLQFLPMEEGRIRPVRDVSNNITSFAYDYFIKDHLGNVRMVLTDETKTDAYPAATMEASSINTESAYYSNLTNTQYAKPSWFNDPVYTGSTQVARVKNTSTTQKIGPNILLKVMAGDSYNIRVASGWSSGSTPTNSPTEVLNDLVLALSGKLASASGGKATQAQLQSPSSGLSTGVSSFLSLQTNSGAPKAYINWILFDEQFKYYSGSFQQVGASGTTTIHLKNGLTVGKNGYLYIYTSNEATNIDVFFDNLQVTHIRGPLLEETHYYPFGLTMAGISSEALNFGQPENKKKYNGIELDKDLELNAYEAQFRDLDPQTARWWQIDPETDGYENLSPYASMYDDPTMISDPLGNEGETCCDGTILGDLIQGGKNLLISASGMLDGALNTVSGGLISSDPFNFRQTLSDDEKGWFDGGVRVGKIIPLVSSPTSGKVSETFEPVPAGNARLKTNEPVQEPQPNTQAKAGDYSNLKDSKSVGPGKKYTPAQKRNILTQNKNQNGGVLKDDVTGETLNPPKRNVKGQKADMNQAEVDHKNARSKGGSNSYSNASVRSKRNNIKKSNKDE